jgi:hypothetical protein
MAAPDQHALVAGQGYVYAGTLRTPSTGVTGLCTPPNGTADGTVHLIAPPQGGPAQAFTWNATLKLWMTTSALSKRLGFPPDYLSRHGWSYVKPAT